MAESKQSEQLSASVIMSSDMVFDLYCEPCSEEGEHVEAEGFCEDCSDYLCRECFKAHRKNRASKHHQLLNKTTMPKKPINKRDISVKTASDTKQCYISGSALLPNNRLVLTDWKNYKVKLVNLQRATVTAELKTNAPWDLTVITADQVAATLPYQQKIMFVKVAETLSIEREMKVNGQCRGIVYGESKLFVTSENPGKIEILTLNGVVERRIDKDSQGDQLFVWPFHVALSPDCKTLYVSDWQNDNIKRITLEGAVIAVYKDNEMSTPAGLVVDQLGRVIVCGAVYDNIHLLNHDCTKIKVLLSGLSFPLSLCYSQETGMLYVGQDDDQVKVYQLSK